MSPVKLHPDSIKALDEIKAKLDEHEKSGFPPIICSSKMDDAYQRGYEKGCDKTKDKLIKLLTEFSSGIYHNTSDEAQAVQSYRELLIKKVNELLSSTKEKVVK